LRLRLAARTGPPNWSIEKRYIKFVDESGATQAAVKELQFCLQTEWYRAESWELLSALLTKMGRKNEADIAMIRAVAYDVHLTEHANFL
jgi:Flp pilus assembly protein TadD